MKLEEVLSAEQILTLKTRAASEEAEVERLGDRIGYGRLMQAASTVWGRKDSQFVCIKGPPRLLTVPCVCVLGGESPGNCDWCCGVGLVTERVMRAIKEST